MCIDIDGDGDFWVLGTFCLLKKGQPVRTPDHEEHSIFPFHRASTTPVLDPKDTVWGVSLSQSRPFGDSTTSYH